MRTRTNSRTHNGCWTGLLLHTHTHDREVVNPFWTPGRVLLLHRSESWAFLINYKTDMPLSITESLPKDIFVSLIWNHLAGGASFLKSDYNLFQSFYLSMKTFIAESLLKKSWAKQGFLVVALYNFWNQTIAHCHIISTESKLSTTNSKDAKVSRIRQKRGKNPNKKKGVVNKMNLWRWSEETQCKSSS